MQEEMKASNDRTRIVEKLNEAASKLSTFELEYRIHSDNKIKYIQNTGAFKIPARSSSLIGTGLIRDITSLINLQRQKDDFIAVVSQELKTPVSVMKGYIKMIE